MGLFRFQKMHKIYTFCGSNGKKAWYTLSIIYSINPRGCPPLGTTSLGQAVYTYIYVIDGIYTVVRIQNEHSYSSFVILITT